jgi:uncharacterized protein
MSVERPVPVPNAETAPFWAATREHRLTVQRCSDCGSSRFYPRTFCPRCGSDRMEWIDCHGTGTVYSYTVLHRPPSEAFAAAVPYVVAIVQLTEGPHLMTNVEGCVPDQVRIGMAVRVHFKDVCEELALPLFEPIEV